VRRDFMGTMTLYQACQQVESDPSCDLLDNHPDEGWEYLRYELDLYDGTRQSLRYSTDIKWWNW